MTEGTGPLESRPVTNTKLTAPEEVALCRYIDTTCACGAGQLYVLAPASISGSAGMRTRAGSGHRQ